MLTLRARADVPMIAQGLATVVRACLTFGAFFAMAACTVSSSSERELGVEEAAQIDSEIPLIRDTIVTGFVTALGRSMASRTSRANLDWRFAVVNSQELNAFALPGGFIYVTRGAIEQSDRLDELAGVLGHEIGHVVRRHTVKQIQQAKKRDVGGILLCTLTRACSTIGGVIAVQVTGDAMTAKYSRNDESEADAEAAVNTVRAGIDPEGLPAFLQKLLDQQTDQPTLVDLFFATHPTDQARISALNRRIAALDLPAGKTLTRDTPEFHRIQEHLRTLPRPPDSTAAQARPR